MAKPHPSFYVSQEDLTIDEVIEKLVVKYGGDFEALKDHFKGILTKELLESFNEFIDLQCNDGNWNYDPYMHGMANGMIFMKTLLTDQSPNYKEAPVYWIDERYNNIPTEEPYNNAVSPESGVSPEVAEGFEDVVSATAEGPKEVSAMLKRKAYGDVPIKLDPSLCHVLQLYWAGQGDPLYAYASRGCPEYGDIGELSAVEDALGQFLLDLDNGDFDDDQNYIGLWDEAVGEVSRLARLAEKYEEMEDEDEPYVRPFIGSVVQTEDRKASALRGVLDEFAGEFDRTRELSDDHKFSEVSSHIHRTLIPMLKRAAWTLGARRRG